MHPTTTIITRARSVFLAAGLAAALASPAVAQTAFTYQGVLKDGVGSPVASEVSVIFRLFDADTGGAQVGPSLTRAVTPEAGVFSESLDFGPSAFEDNQPRWLEIEVDGDLLGRQALEATPFAVNTRGISVSNTGTVGSVIVEHPYLNNTALAIKSDSGSASTLRFQEDSSLVWDTGKTGAADDFFLRNRGSSRVLTIEDLTGNIGIGTDAPQAPLDVITSGNFLGIQARGTSPALTLDNTLDPDTRWTISALSDDRLRIRDTSTGKTIMMLDAQDGHVGIGVEEPGRLLHVRGANGLVQVDRGGDSAGLIMRSFSDTSYSTEVSDWRMLASMNGDFVFQNANNGFSRPLVVTADDRVGIGIDNPTTSLDVNGAVTIRGGADIVEGFDSICGTAFEPGTVLVIDADNPGMLTCAEAAYDKKVAGVVSGAGGVQPGIKLGQDGVMDGDIPVAMTGRVYVKATATNGAIEPGDLLTTADLAGHAMKATDADRLDGTVIGKAMGPLESGEGLVLVLVNLQ
jgi:hypothetical protein